MAAIASDDARVLNCGVIALLRISDAAHEQRELERRERLFRGPHEPVPIEQRSVILVDDGVATGAIMRAAAVNLRKHHPLESIAAVPVGAPSSCALLLRVVDQLICLARPTANEPHMRTSMIKTNRAHGEIAVR